MANLLLEFVDSPKQMEGKIARALAKDVDKTLVRAINRMITPIRRLIADALKGQPEVRALGSGDVLAGHFGLPDGTRRIGSIIDIWTKSLTIRKISTKVSGSKINAGLEIRAIRSDFSDVLGQSEGRITTEKGEELPWLEWFLLFGDKSSIIKTII